MYFLFDIVKSYVSIGFLVIVLIISLTAGTCIVNVVSPYIGQ